jgi:hypothetical protein
MRARSAILVLFATLGLAGSGAAQTCFTGRPLPKCHDFTLLELGYAHRLGGGPLLTGGSPQVHYLNGELGWMVNRSPRLAVGGSLYLGALVDYAFELRPGLKGRVRYWLGERTALDAGVGPILGRSPGDLSLSGAQRRRLGGTAHLGLSLHDALHLTLQAEYLPNPVDRDLVGYVGARLGSKPALWSGLIAGSLLGLGAAAMAN